MIFLRRKRWMAGALALAAIVLWASLASTPADTARFSTHTTLYEKWRTLFEIVTIPADGAAPAQAARFFAGSAQSPLIVELPAWRGTPASLSGRETPLVSAVRNRNWSYIRPALAGGNTNSDGCCSPSALAQIAGAVRYAMRHAPVDEANIFIVGESGGGYSALCAMMQAIVTARGIYAWVPISDLAAWHAQRQPDAYARDVRACTGNAATLDEAEAQRRSPLFMPSAKPELLMRTKIYAGIHDGWTGSVPISHSLRMFNHIAQTIDPDKKIDELTARALLERTARPLPAMTIAGRAVFLHRQAHGASLTIFDGGHEMLTRQVIADIEAAMTPALQPRPQ